MIKLVSDTIDKKDIDSLVSWLTQDEIPRLTKGELTWELERKWSKKLGCNFSVFVNSGSSAILLALAALKERGTLKNNKIVVPGLSWATDVSSPMLLGFTPILCDCNLHDLSCDLNQLETLFKTEQPSCFILVSPLGLVPDMDRIVRLCEEYDVILLEDVCESLGSKYNQNYLGTFGFASFFSTYYGHHLSTIEGGFICTNDEEFYHLLLMMRSHGWDRDLPSNKQNELRSKFNVNEFDSLYHFYVPGFNLRSTDLQAFLGINALDKLDEFCQLRNLNFYRYLSEIKINELDIRISDSDFVSNFAFPILNENRNIIIEKLINGNVEVRPLIAGDMSMKTMWVKKYPKQTLTNCQRINDYGFYIPNHQGIKESDINYISQIINNA